MCDKILTRRVLSCQSNFTVILSRGRVDLSYKTCHCWCIELQWRVSIKGWSWSYGSLIYNYLCNQCLSPLKLWVWTPILCDKVCQWLATGRSFSPGTPVSSTDKTECHDIVKILLKVALNTINQIKSNLLWIVSINCSEKVSKKKLF
jgi:hypothetical protein